jgi:hypothetical protein
MVMFVVDETFCMRMKKVGGSDFDVTGRWVPWEVV